MKFSGKIRSIINSFTFFIVIASISGCSIINNVIEPETPVIESKLPYQQNTSYAEVRFYLQIPESVNDEIVFEIVDDVTGIEFNPTRYSMEKIESKTYQITFPAKLGSVIKYRYFRNGELPIYETDFGNNRISYRAAYVSSASEFNDILTNWTDQTFSYEFGQLQGQIINSESKSPIPNALVIIGGLHSYSSSQGKFSFPRIAPGKHNLLVATTDGEFQIFQQEAVIGEGLTTPAEIELSPSKYVNLTFVVQSPKLINNESSIRIIGNTFQLGNIFSETYNGESVIASRAPVLSQLPDGSHTISMSFPVGFDLVYKYTLGSGFWNSELSPEGNFNTRHILIPDQDTLINDVVDSWTAPDTAPLYFKVTVPENTPQNDIVSIQFSPFGWSSPIPMSKTSDTTWSYTLYGPLNIVGNVNYRFCRNDACNIADDSFSSGTSAIGYSFIPSNQNQIIENEVSSWINWSSKTSPTAIIAPEIINRGSDFIAGIQFASNQGVYDQIYSHEAIQNILDLGANYFILPVEWTLQSINPVVLSPLISENLLWKDLVSTINTAQKSGLNIILVPTIKVNSLALTQYMQMDVNPDWENKFKSAYNELLNYAIDLATFMDIKSVIFPTDIYSFSKLDNYSVIKSLVVDQTSLYTTQVNSNYSGKLILSIRSINEMPSVETLSLFDGFLVKTNWNLDAEPGDNTGLTNSYKNYLDQTVYKLFESTSKPILLELEYPSAVGAETGCVTFGEECIDFDLLNLSSTDLRSNIPIDLQLQTALYQAALTAVNDTPWVQGVISNGYNSLVALQDASSSIRGKPAADVLWYWYPRLIGKTK